ncbi:hypothetical protein AMTRI_Chr02g221910 [Amborella trichopoda]|uniref:Beta-amylase n=1 Tax=Amborella trichopoda TaxID=13333 RepID=U5D619_AMBTC|nr:inactive beta-amylase 9 [Amborella trichopoda]ERN16877.1 hypothetical protein AMTR_s00057p00154460 [Amborella trichopoda]|eukprot:XP_006855410.1 inactive beta-amylase 9 [Amborella trichopoda]
MEMSMVGCSQMNAERVDLGFQRLPCCGHERICNKRDQIKVNLRSKWRRGAIRVSLKEITPEKCIVREGCLKMSHDKTNRLPLFVGLPLDTISACNALNHAKAIAAGLRPLKLLGVEGVSFPIWWGIVEGETAGSYDWSSHLEVAEMVREAGLKLNVAFNFHGSTARGITLPKWVLKVGEENPDIFFTDRGGKRFRDCLSLGTDELALLSGKSPLQAYGDFMESFKSEFSNFLGSTITELTIGLGPNGELRYPSLPENPNSTGVGEFQCYDKHMLANLQQHARTLGHHQWGYSGPHDAPPYDSSPDSSNFFRQYNGSWETPYGNFFLSWYSNCLISHGNRMLSKAAGIFRNLPGNSFPVRISGKIPTVHQWCNTRSHAAELTSGFYETSERDGYSDVMKMFAENSAGVVLPSMDLSDSIVKRVKEACDAHGVSVSGENSQLKGNSGGFAKIKKNLEMGLAGFTYMRMGADFFSPEHWPLFTDFIWHLEMPEKDSDDVAVGSKGAQTFGGVSVSHESKEKTLQLQA